MVLRAVALALLGACGKMNFDDASNMDGIAHDEDLDGINDPQDNCPAAFNDRQEDQDGDGVGDACDPNPTTPGDRLIAAGFFTDSFGNWVPNSAAAWLFEDGGLVPAETDADAVAVTMSLTIAARAPTLQINLAVGDYGVSTVEQHSVTLTISYANETTICTLFGNEGSPFNVVNVTLNDNNSSNLPGVVAGTPTPLYFTRDATGATCRAGAVMAFNDGPPITSANATFTIDIRHARVSILNAVIYDVP